MDDLMLIQFQQSGIPIPTLIMTYAPIEKFNEFDPGFITDYCRFINPGCRLLYPVMVDLDGRQELLSVLTDDDTTFEKGLFDVAEPVNGEDIYPSAIDMVIVPLLAFDKKGFRVGYGKGYYDKFLARCRKDCIKIGFSYFEALDNIEDRSTDDIPLDFCITHERVYEF